MYGVLVIKHCLLTLDSLAEAVFYPDTSVKRGPSVFLIIAFCSSEWNNATATMTFYLDHCVLPIMWQQWEGSFLFQKYPTMIPHTEMVC